MNGIRARDESAFAVAYTHTADVLASFANGMMHDRAFAEDAVQQAFLELVTASPSIKGDGRSLRAWLFRSVRFTCLDEMRRRRRHPEMLVDEVRDPHGSAAIADHEESMVAGDGALVGALRQLTDRQRTLLSLKHVVGLDGNEIAAITGGNRASVYAATRRAERHLSSLLSNRGKDAR